jgi:DNA-binding winged helix-turn-helix (wHTH) protein
MTDIFSFGPFVLNRETYTVLQKVEGSPDKTIHLRPKAFDVLRYLVENPGRVISRQEFLTELWPKTHVQAETLKGHVLAIRSALRDRSNPPRYVENVRGRGYRFIAPVTDADSIHPNEPTIVVSPHIVGRRDEFEQLRNAASAALSATSQLVFVIGEAGIGKTALVNSVCSDGTIAREFNIARGQCVEGFGLTEPYYPVLEALSQLCKGPSGDSVKRDLMALAPTWALQLPGQISSHQRKRLQQEAFGAQRERMLREICEFLEVLAKQRPLALVFEDLHWADHATIDVLAVLARRRSQARLLLVATYRGQEAADNYHPVRQLNEALLLRKLCRQVSLRALPEEAVAQLLGGSHTDRELTRTVRERSGGNPLFLSAILDDMLEKGLIEHVQGEWKAKTKLANIEMGVPPTLAQVIESQIQRLSNDEQAVLQAAAITGVTFTATTATAAIGLPNEMFESICEELARKDCFIRREKDTSFSAAEPGRVYAFRHAVYRQVFYERQGPIRRKNAHFNVAKQLEGELSSPRRDPLEAELARHFAAAEEWVRALSYLRITLRTAKERFADQDALAILSRALEIARHLPKKEREESELEFLEGKASLLAAVHDPIAAETYQALATAAEQYGDIDTRARALVGLAYALGWQDQKRCIDVLGEALSLSDEQLNSQQQARTRMSASVWRIWARGWNEGDAKTCEEAFPVLQNGADPLVAAWGTIEYCMLGLISTRYGKVGDAIQVAFSILRERASDRAEFNIERAIWMHYLGVPWSSCFAGALGRSLEEFDSSIAFFEKNGNAYALRTLRLHRAWHLIHCMDFQGALASSGSIDGGDDNRTSTGHGDGTVFVAEERLCKLIQGVAYAGLGQQERAVELFADVDQLMTRSPLMFDWYWRMPLEWSQVSLHLKNNNIVEAKKHAMLFEQLAGGTQERTWQTLALEANARVYLQEGNHARAIQYVEAAIKAGKHFETPLAD